MRLTKDLYAINGDILVRGGVNITPAIVNKIRRMGDERPAVFEPLKNTPIFADFKKVFDDVRYVNMLKSPAARREVCDIVGGLEVEDDLLSELYNMKAIMPYTYSHMLIVAAISIKLASACGPKVYDVQTAARCGFTHDLGKTRIPISLLDKRGKLTKKEKIVMDTHSVAGYLLLEYYLKKERTVCALANLNHHERLDGSGYPNGIKKIDKYSRLISIVDILDALMTKRPYRSKMFTLRASLDYLLQQARMNKLDMNIVLSLVSLARKKKADIKSIKVSKIIREELPD